MTKLYVYNRLVRFWNKALGKAAFHIFQLSTQGKAEKIYVHGIICAISLHDNSYIQTQIISVLRKVLLRIKEVDTVNYMRVLANIEKICVSDTFKKDFSYDVYYKCLYIKLPFKGIEVDPDWVVGEIACYLVERAIFGKIYHSFYETNNSKYYCRISRILYEKRKKFGKKLGDSWEDLYKTPNVEDIGYTPLFE